MGLGSCFFMSNLFLTRKCQGSRKDGVSRVDGAEDRGQHWQVAHLCPYCFALGVCLRAVLEVFLPNVSR